MIAALIEAAVAVEVSAQGALRRYGRNGAVRGVNCRTCPHKIRCPYYWDMTADPMLVALYADAESVDGYQRDACAFREDIDIYDTMAATVRYSSGAMMSYSRNAFMPIEGYHLAFNGLGAGSRSGCSSANRGRPSAAWTKSA